MLPADADKVIYDLQILVDLSIELLTNHSLLFSFLHLSNHQDLRAYFETKCSNQMDFCDQKVRDQCGPKGELAVLLKLSLDEKCLEFPSWKTLEDTL